MKKTRSKDIFKKRKQRSEIKKKKTNNVLPICGIVTQSHRGSLLVTLRHVQVQIFTVISIYSKDGKNQMSCCI